MFILTVLLIDIATVVQTVVFTHSRAHIQNILTALPYNPNKKRHTILCCQNSGYSQSLSKSIKVVLSVQHAMNSLYERNVLSF